MWEPHKLSSCVDKIHLGYLTAILSASLLVWYLMIAYRWFDACRYASKDTRNMWLWLVIIFIACAVAGYGTLLLAVFAPKTAVIVRIIFLSIQNVACPLFWYCAANKKFTIITSNEHIGQQLQTINIKNLDNSGLGILTRQLLTEHTKRILNG